jgi:hypothetical protein
VHAWLTIICPGFLRIICLGMLGIMDKALGKQCGFSMPPWLLSRNPGTALLPAVLLIWHQFPVDQGGVDLMPRFKSV